MTVVIAGSGFEGVTDVTFGGVSVGAGGFTVDNPAQIRATVPTLALSGPIEVVSLLGTAQSSTDFTVLADCGAVAHGTQLCDSGTAVALDCTVPWTNLTGVFTDGCEHFSPSAEICNGLDDDGNGIVDDNVGEPVGALVAHGIILCVGGALKSSCDSGWVDTDNNAGDGCETPVDAAVRRR